MRFYLRGGWVILIAGNEDICKMSFESFEKLFGFKKASELTRDFQ